MRGTSVGVIAFISGCCVGALCTWRYAKNKYKQIADDEIQEIRDFYDEKIEHEQEDAKQAEIKDESDDEKDDISLNKYSTRPSDLKASKEEDMKSKKKPYVIPPEEFGELDDYDQVSLTYYEDNYLANDRKELVTDVEGIIGWDNINRIGEYEDDAIHVRNDELKIDYEILQVAYNYSDVEY